MKYDIDVLSQPVRPPVILSLETQELLRRVGVLAGTEQVGIIHIGLALLDQAQREPPDETSARRALDRFRVDATELRAAYEEELTKAGVAIPQPPPTPPPSAEGKDFYTSPFAGRPGTKGLPVDPLPVGATAPRAAGKDFYTSPFADAPDTKSDALRARTEVVALARVVALRDTPAPLAVGIFGDWGAGKTSFMDTIHDFVAGELEGREPYHGKIVQIRFNAWHYIETNLWASLVSHVFTELDRKLREDIGDSVDALHGALATVRRAEVSEADRVIAAQARLQNALAARPASTGLDLGDLASGAFRVFYEHLDQEDRDRIAEGVKDLGIKEGNEAWERAEKAALEARSLVKRVRLIIGEFRRGWRHGDSAPLVWGAALLGALLLAALFGRVVAQWLGETLGVFSGIGTAALTAAIAVSKLPQAAGSVVGLFEQLNHRRRQAEETALAAVEKEIVAARAALADAVTEFRTATPLGRLRRFIRDKAADESYAKHLGLVAMIRKDFELLTACIVDAQPVEVVGNGANSEEQERIKRAKAIAAEPGHADSGNRDPAELPAELDEHLKPYGRIILYIDDLDRCTTDKVVEVLQAVHLLLAFKLFVVFVAVDYRWLRAALEKAYSGQLQALSGHGEARAASAADYLEKIFQIPYWVRRLDPGTSAAFLNDLINKAQASRPAKEEVSRTSEEPTGGQPRPLIAEQPVPQDKAISDQPTAPLQTETTLGHQQDDVPSRRFASQPSQPAVPLEPIDISKEERTLMAALAPYAGRTPRQLKRFFNVYRVIKASSGGDDLDWRAVLVLLAITTRAPDRFAELVPVLESQTDMNELKALLHRSDLAATKDGRACLAALDAAASEVTPTDLVQQVRVVARFSFCEQDRLGMAPRRPLPAPTPVPA